MECKGDTHLHRVCVFYNLALWNGTLHYTTTDKGTLAHKLPEVPLTWADSPPFSSLSFSDLRTLRVERPGALPGWGGRGGLRVIPEAIVWVPTFQDNYGHLLGEHGPTLHNVACTYLGRCRYSPEDTSRLHLLTLEEESAQDTTGPAAGREMLACFSKHRPVRLGALGGVTAPTLLERVVVGVSPTCRAYPQCRARNGRGRLSREMVESWRGRVMACVGLSPEARAQARNATVLLVDRPTRQGRALLNSQDLQATLQERLRGQASVMRLNPAGKTLAEQARAYAQADILIQVHGAALGNLIFLKQGAAVIDLVPQNNLDKHAWLYHMAADYRPLYLSPHALLPQKSALLLSRVKRAKQWPLLTSDSRSAILQDGTCPTDEAVHSAFDAYSACNFGWFLKGSNMVADSAAVVDTAQRTLHELSLWKVPVSGYVTKRFKLW